MSDRALDRAIILDTEEDIATTVAVVCNSCGTELQVTQIEEVPEKAIVLEVGICERCSDDRFRHGYQEGTDHERDRGQGMGF